MAKESCLENLVNMKFLNTYSGKKVLITGHTGFKGGWLTIWLKMIGAEVIGFSLDPNSEKGIFKSSNIANQIKDYRGDLVGICGGYQMLGNFIKDPYFVEGSIKEIKAMELLDIETILEKEKVTTRVEAIGFNLPKAVYGYEIHMGITKLGERVESIFNIVKENGKVVNYFEGAKDSDGRVMGSYIHGIFDGVAFREYLLNKIRGRKGLELKKSMEYGNLREKELDSLAHIVRGSLDMKEIYRIMGIEKNV